MITHGDVALLKLALAASAVSRELTLMIATVTRDCKTDFDFRAEYGRWKRREEALDQMVYLAKLYQLYSGKLHAIK